MVQRSLALRWACYGSHIPKRTLIVLNHTRVLTSIVAVYHRSVHVTLAAAPASAEGTAYSANTGIYQVFTIPTVYAGIL